VNNFSSPFDNLASEYDSWFDGDGKPIFDIEVEAFRNILPLLPKPWLEIGVGSGRFARALGIENGIDPSYKFVEMARARGINASIGRGENTSFERESIGTVFLIVTLCFLDSPLDVMKEAHRILIPGGKLVLSFVAKDSPWGKYYEQKKGAGHRFYQHATFYKCNEVTRFTIEAGFMGEKMVSTLWQKPGDVRHMESPREGYFHDAGFTIIVAVKAAGED